MKKSVVIPSHKHLDDFLRPCLESIIKYTDLTDVEVIVVCNGDGDTRSKEYIESLGEHFKCIFVEEGIGFTKATNLGVRESTGEVIIFCNNDCVLLPQPKNLWLDILCNPLKDNVGLTGNLKLWDHSVERRFCLFFMAATPRHIWDKIGGLDEAWSPGGGEDIEFCLQVEQLGYKVLQVPGDEPCKTVTLENGVTVNSNVFPNYHPGEGTAMDDEHKEMWIRHIAEVRAKLEHKYKLPPGWFMPGDIEEYRRLVEDVPEGGYIAELGCYKGRSICSVADIILRKKLKVDIVDVFTGTVSEGQCEPDYQREFEYNCSRFGLSPNVFKGTLDEAALLTPDKKYDLIFIDADHQYSAIKNDIEKWLPKIKEHGKISGHDYGTHPGISKAVNEKWSNVNVSCYVWSKRL